MMSMERYDELLETRRKRLEHEIVDATVKAVRHCWGYGDLSLRPKFIQGKLKLIVKAFETYDDPDTMDRLETLVRREMEIVVRQTNW